MTASAHSSENTVKKIYHTVIEEVIMNVRETFLDEGCDEQLLQELKQMWEAKLNQSKAINSNNNNNNNEMSSGVGGGGGGPSHESGPLRLPTLPVDRHHGQQPSSSRGASSGGQYDHAQTSGSANRQMTSGGSGGQSSRAPIGALGASNAPSHLLDPTKAALQALPHSYYKDTKSGKLGHQVDGAHDGSSSEEEDDEDIGIGVGSAHVDDEPDNSDDDDDDDKINNDDQSSEHGREDPEPLNSGDDLTEPGSPNSNSDLFDTEHVIVCQYDKITRIKNKWKFHLKDGIMNINGKDYLFSRANGDAEW